MGTQAFEPFTYERRGDALVTPTGGVLYRPCQLPQDRWLVSAPDGIHHSVYKRNGWLRRLLMGKRWRCVSGDATFQDLNAAWRWVEEACVNRLGPDDWHGVGYARWMQAQTWRRPESYPDRLPPPSFWSHYTTEPLWVSQWYQHGPPDWDMPEMTEA